MAKIGSYRRIFKQDYSPDIQPDIDTLSVTLNDSFETIYGALNNQVTFTENINCTLVTFTVTVDSKSVPTAPLAIKLNSFQKTVNGMIIINAVAKDGTSTPDSGIFVDYTINNNITSSSNVTNTSNTSQSPLTINVNKIKGLPSSKVFTITAIIV